MFRSIMIAAALTTLCAAPAFAQVEEEAIVVTGSRIRAFEDLTLPHVTMKRRPDSVIIELEVRSDTRDFTARREEIRQALRGLDARSRPANVSLAIVDDEAGIVRPFSMAAAEELITTDRRPDTSLITIHVRTVVTSPDTLESVRQRIARFVLSAPKPGRVELETGDTHLVLNSPEQYRAPLLAAVTADGRAIAAGLGAGYGVALSGLERQVAWRRTADLELTLFVPYALSVSPAQ